MKTIHLLLSAAVGLFLLPSCVCNTSGKLDTVGKTRNAYIVEHPKALYWKNGAYYIKGESVVYNTQTNSLIPLGDWWDGSGPDLATQPIPGARKTFYRPIIRTVNNPYGSAYRHERDRENELATTSMLANYCKLKPDTQWIPSEEFEKTPSRTLPIQETREQTERLVFLDLGDTQRSTGNLLRTPIVGIMALTIDTPVSLVNTIGGSLYYLCRPSAFYQSQFPGLRTPGLRSQYPSVFAHGS